MGADVRAYKLVLSATPRPSCEVCDKAAIEGRLTRGIGIANLRDAPAGSSRQYARVGLAL